MTKKNILLFSSIFAFFITHAQDELYLPLAAKNKTWSVLTSENIVVDPNTGREVTDTLTEHFAIDTDQDSLFEGKIWHPVYTTRDTFFDWGSSNLELIGIIREENWQVFYRGKYDQFFNNPIYDFNLLPGDTILERNNDIGEPIFFVVTDVDSVILDDDVIRRRIHTGYWHRPHGQESFDFYPADIVWVEGIGDLTHGLLPQPGFQLNNLRSLDRLLCVTIDQLPIYTNPLYQACFKENIISVWREPIELPVRIFPNPVTDRLQIDNLDLLPPGIIIITDLLGRIQYQKELDSTLQSLEINVSGWLPQPYLVTYRSPKVYRFRSVMLLKFYFN